MLVVLWVASGVLAALVMVAGLTKVLQPKARLHAAGLRYEEDLKAEFIRRLRWAEVLGAVDRLLPPLTGVAPVLTPVAAVCLAVMMVGAVIAHLRPARDCTGGFAICAAGPRGVRCLGAAERGLGRA